VLINLVGNALKFTEQGSVRIAVASRVDDDGLRVEVSVSDTGIGIEPERVEGMFDAFTQADAGTARRYGGSGLGLSISRRLVRLMGGDIAVVSDPGAGSRFRFDVLLQPGDAEMAQARDRRVLSRRPQLAGVRVLLVEDNAINQEVAIQILARAGVHTEAASGGREALTLLDQGLRAGRAAAGVGAVDRVGQAFRIGSAN
jgi:two-component system sensor histidine kinase/response regulator